MKTEPTIIAACDGTPHATDVVSYAAGLAGKCDAHLILAHIIDERNVEAVQQAFGHLPYPAEIEWDDYVKELIRQAKGELSLLAQQHRSSRLLITQHVEIGEVGESLLTLISEKRADVVIVGNARRHLTYGHLFGGTLHQLFRLCPVPLLSIRTGHDDNERSGAVEPMIVKSSKAKH